MKLTLSYYFRLMRFSLKPLWWQLLLIILFLVPQTVMFKFLYSLGEVKTIEDMIVFVMTNPFHQMLFFCIHILIFKNAVKKNAHTIVSQPVYRTAWAIIFSEWLTYLCISLIVGALLYVFSCFLIGTSINLGVNIFCIHIYFFSIYQVLTKIRFHFIVLFLFLMLFVLNNVINAFWELQISYPLNWINKYKDATLKHYLLHFIGFTSFNILLSYLILVYKITKRTISKGDNN
jgi:hypothetical protein